MSNLWPFYKIATHAGKSPDLVLKFPKHKTETKNANGVKNGDKYRPMFLKNRDGAGETHRNLQLLNVY